MATAKTKKRGAGPKPGKAKRLQSPQAIANPFWDFSLEVYARDGTAQACLALQDSKGFDVNLMLFCCWAGVRGRELATGEIDSLVGAVRHWRGHVVEPLRDVRRQLSTGVMDDGNDVAVLLAYVKDAELEAESVQQRILFETLPIETLPIKTLPIKTGEASAKIAAGNLKSYADVLKVECDSAVTADLAAVLRGAFPMLAPLEAVWTLI